MRIRIIVAALAARHEAGATASFRWVGRFGGLLLAAPLLCPLAAVTFASPAVAQAAPTCRGVPATIVGTPGDDYIHGTPSDDVIVGDRGNDTIWGAGGDDLICGGPTRDKDADGDSVYQTLNGGPGDDILVGGSGIDDLYGDQGADLLIGRAGGDTIYGGANKDSIRGGPDDDYTLSGDEGDDDVYGGRGEDFISDPSGNNTLRGGPDNDVTESGPGNDTIRGGRGVDAASYVELISLTDGGGSHCNDITADLSKGTASGKGFGTDTLQGIEGVRTGGGNDVLIGDEGPNEFYTGWPCFDETTPTESVTGNGGFDRISFDSENLDFGSAPGPVTVDLQSQSASWDNQGGPNPVVITMHSIESVVGTEWDDVILGDDGPNVLIGMFGNDHLDGRGGDDSLLGYPGNDSLDGGLGANLNDGGRGNDTCLNPNQAAGAVNCEN